MFEKQWKIKTNVSKFAIITIGFYKAPNIIVENTVIPYAEKVKLLGLTITRNNFYVKQVKLITEQATRELKKLWRFRNLKKKLKIRLFKALILPILTYPITPLNIYSVTQIKKLQTSQNKAIRWIANEYWPINCPITQRQREFKIEPIGERVKRLAEGVWSKIFDENDEFFQNTISINMGNPHKWFPSSYLRTFD